MSSPLYYAKCAKAWDGDGFGNEWTCGASVRPLARDRFAVYEDDGKGNGNFLASFTTVFDAKAYADAYCKFLDAGGYADSPEAIEMCRIAETCGAPVDAPERKV